MHKSDTKRKSLNNIKLKGLIIILIIILFSFILLDRIQEKTINTDSLSLIINNLDVTSDLEDYIIKQGDTIYLSIENIKQTLDKTIYVEPETGMIITTSEKKVATLNVDSTSVEINGAIIQLQSPVFKTMQDKIYLPISELSYVYDIDFKYIDETHNIIIDYFSKSLKTAEIANDCNVKNSKSKLSKTIDNVKKGDKVIFIEKKNGWAKIRTQKGMIGYIKDSSVINIKTERENFEEKELENFEEFFEKDLTNDVINNFTSRKILINGILSETLFSGKKCVKVIYNGEKNSIDFERFKIEAKPILKEAGISIDFE